MHIFDVKIILSIPISLALLFGFQCTHADVKIQSIVNNSQKNDYHSALTNVPLKKLIALLDAHKPEYENTSILVDIINHENIAQYFGTSKEGKDTTFKKNDTIIAKNATTDFTPKNATDFQNIPSLSSDLNNKDYQTIILYPRDLGASCNNVMLIGRWEGSLFIAYTYATYADEFATSHCYANGQKITHDIRNGTPATTGDGTLEIQKSGSLTVTIDANSRATQLVASSKIIVSPAPPKPVIPDNIQICGESFRYHGGFVQEPNLGFTVDYRTCKDLAGKNLDLMDYACKNPVPSSRPASMNGTWACHNYLKGP